MSTIRGFKLDPETHDLSLDEGGRLEYVEGSEATAQEAKTRLLFFQGECFANLLEGIPWIQVIFQKGTSDERIKAIIRRALLSVPSILDVVEVVLERNAATREGTITWTARERDGSLITSADFGPLVIPADVGT